MLPENISTYGAEVDALFYLILAVTGVAFVLVEGLLVYFLIRYRQRPGRRAYATHGNPRIETLWTVVPGLMLLGLAIYQYRTWLTIKQNFPDESQAVLVGIRANQFEWNAIYTGEDGVLGTPDDVEAPINVLHFPVNRPILLSLDSEDVIHSFFVPVLRLKQDVVPGLRGNRAWFQATQTGEFEVACAELCGLGHYRMRGRLIIETQEEFDAWLAELAAGD
jgi:cytochrome c oxidase subunit 2